MVEFAELSSITVYCVLKLPLESVLMNPCEIEMASHVELSCGRLAVVPPGSEHSMIWSPVGSAVGSGKPVPVTVIACPSANGPAGIVTTGPCALALPGRNHTSVPAIRRTSPNRWTTVHVLRFAHTRNAVAVTPSSPSSQRMN